MRRDLIVPKGKCPLDVLAEQGEGIRNTWIFLHESVVSNLENSEGVARNEAYNGGTLLFWAATEKYPETRIVYRSFELTAWYLLTNVLAENIAYSSTIEVNEPEEVIFVKMEGAA